MNPRLDGRDINVMFRIGALVHGRADVIHLEFGEPDFPTPAHIVAAAQASLANERQTYGPGPGLPSLRAAIAERVARVNHFAPAAEQVIATMGGTGGLMCALLALCAPGDEVLTPDPAWPGYDAMIAAAGATQVPYALASAQGWDPDLAALEAICTPRAKVLILNSPSNPTGAVFSRATTERLVEFAQRRDLWILSDECYDQLIYAGEHLSLATLDPERVVTVGTCSKAYAMTGWRVGWAVAPARIATAIGIASTSAINNIPTFAQRAAEAALTGPQECVAEMREAYRRRRDLATGLLDAHGLLEYTPTGAFYLLINAALAAGLPDDASFDSLTFAEALLREKGIAVGPGAAFGERIQRYVRVSLARSDDEIRDGVTGALDFARSYTERVITR
jgi:aspartate aminotransferase/aminotransferase